MNKLLYVSGIILSIILFYSCEDKPVLPSLTTKTVTEISTTTAVSGGSITDDGGAQIVTGGVCWNTSDDPTTENSRTIEGGDLSSFTSNITLLLPNTTYFLRAYATNSVGTGYGKSVSFRTLGDKPTSSSLNASNITINSVTFNSSVNANLLSTTVTFEYGLTTSYGNTVTIPQNPITGNSNVNVTADLTGLTPGTTYHFRIKTENSLGITTSGDKTFTTLGKMPDVTVSVVTNLLVKTATISGSVNPNFLSSMVTFEWGTTTSYGNSITAAQSQINGSAPVIVSTNLTGLAPATTYHFRIKATNDLGTSISDDMTFTTRGQIPSAITQNVTNLQITQARLSGLVNPHYLPTTIFFEWGTTTSYGNTLALTQNPFEGNTPIDVFTDLSGLSPETTYYFRVIATNELGTTIGEDLTFKTFAAIDADGNGYYTVKLGTQTWLTENLKTTKFLNGDLIGTTNPATKDISFEGTPNYQWAPYGIESNVALYGRLYSWYAVIDSRHLCPAGWGVPSDAEWTTLTNFLINNGYGIEGSGNDIAKAMAAETGWNPIQEEGPVTNDPDNNSSGFTALPAGYRYGGDRFTTVGYICAWWTSSEYQANTAWYRELYYSVSYLNIGITSKHAAAFSIRCIKE